MKNEKYKQNPISYKAAKHCSPLSRFSEPKKKDTESDSLPLPH